MTERVYCTADRDWPEIGKTVIYVEYGQAHLGKLLFKDDDGHEWQNETGTQWFLKQTPIYWRYEERASLKDEYERQKENA